ncbi:MAG TPA: CDP-alcohol phosphatidyltransferase family protein [Candidatus Norongarragalinales archaeon]|jgi:CDP-diacylglycerol--serine O-phosphatidyltransferase|nr:CDP-alcohol phosphatidyltransferase family protein [Candidatus Norongarragalinales archaeon]
MQKIAALQVKDYLTLANAACGALSIAAAFAGQMWFWLLIPLAVVFDALDGKFARLTKTQNKLGDSIDSMADMVSFGVAPFFAALTILGPNWLLWIGGVLFVLAAVVRLSFFAVSPTRAFFVGMPAPAAALIALFFVMLDVWSHHGGTVAGIAMLVLAFLMVSDYKFPKA